MGTTHRHSRNRVAIIIPACNEQDVLQTLKIRLAELHRGLRERFIVFYLFVDDGSKDRTVELLPRAVPAGAPYRIISHEQNRGIGEAFRTGFAAVGSAEIVCTIDADCSYRADRLIPMVELIAEGKADVVVASPYHPSGRVEGVPRWRVALSRCCSRLYRMRSPLQLYTYTSMFRAYRGSCVRNVQFQSAGFVSIVEILMSASRQGFRIHEMPAVLRGRSAGTSKMRVVRNVFQHLRFLVGCPTARGFALSSFGRRAAEDEIEEFAKDPGSLKTLLSGTQFRQGKI